MMKTKFLAPIFLAFTFFFAGCSKEGADGPSDEFTYRLSGPSATRVTVQYTPTMTDPNMTQVPGDLEYEEQVSPPWEKKVRLHRNVSGAGFSAGVSDGVPGAGYTISILDHTGKVLKTGDFTVDAYGNGVLLLNYYRNHP